MRELDEVTGAIIDAALGIHRGFGPGLLESVYEEAFRIDLVVDDQVIVEHKSVEKAAPIHSKRLLTYLKLANEPVGLLINFGAPTLKEGLQRMVNRLPPSASPRLRVNQMSP